MGKKKKLKKFNKLLLKYQTNRDVIKITSQVTEGESDIYGIILAMSNEFMHLAEYDNFKFNGEIIIRLDHFDYIRCNKADKTSKRILKSEKQLTISKPKKTSIDLSNWNFMFDELKKRDIHVIVECENLKKPTFTIGSIEKIKKNSLEIWNYDSSGKLNKKHSAIKFRDITLLKFNDQYSTIFRKYLKQPKKRK